MSGRGQITCLIILGLAISAAGQGVRVIADGDTLPLVGSVPGSSPLLPEQPRQNGVPPPPVPLPVGAMAPGMVPPPPLAPPGPPPVPAMPPPSPAPAQPPPLPSVPGLTPPPSPAPPPMPPAMPPPPPAAPVAAAAAGSVPPPPPALPIQVGATATLPPLSLPTPSPQAPPRPPKTTAELVNELLQRMGASNTISSSVGFLEAAGPTEVHYDQMYNRTSPEVYGAQTPRLQFMEAGSGTSNFEQCSRSFNLVGSNPRSLAIILVRWSRENYYSKAMCCKDIAPSDPAYSSCDCVFGGDKVKYHEIPLKYPATAYERMFSDECDGKGAINRAIYDMSGGRITFTTNDTTPDPTRVNVYGWATLTAQRTSPTGECLDWCGLARQQLGVNASKFQHVVCMGLWGAWGPTTKMPLRNFICDNDCTGRSGCTDTCPIGSGLTTGCGCGSCAAAWGTRSSCHATVNTTQYTGFAVPLTVWPNTGLIGTSEGMKTFILHELLHNLGFAHSGSLQCATNNGTIERSAQHCGQFDEYGNFMSLMGHSNAYNLPLHNKLMHHWVSNATVYTINTTGSGEFTLWAINSREMSRPDRTYKWWTNQLLGVRIDLSHTPGGTASSYMCPCNPKGRCPSCDRAAPGFNQCKVPCCLDPECAVKEYRYYFVEYHRPFSYDYSTAWLPPQVVVHFQVGSNSNTDSCPGAMLVPAFLDLANASDPSSSKPRTRWGLTAVGQKFRDAVRGVEVELLGLHGNRVRVRISRWQV